MEIQNTGKGEKGTSETPFQYWRIRIQKFLITAALTYK